MTHPTDPIDTPEQLLTAWGNRAYMGKPAGISKEKALEMLERHYKAQTEQVLREVIGENADDRWTDDELWLETRDLQR